VLDRQGPSNMIIPPLVRAHDTCSIGSGYLQHFSNQVLARPSRIRRICFVVGSYASCRECGRDFGYDRLAIQLCD